MSATAAQPPSRQGGSDQNQGGGEAEGEGANRRGKAITTCVNCGKDSHDLHLCVHCSQSQCFNCRKKHVDVILDDYTQNRKESRKIKDECEKIIKELDKSGIELSNSYSRAEVQIKEAFDELSESIKQRKLALIHELREKKDEEMARLKKEQKELEADVGVTARKLELNCGTTAKNIQSEMGVKYKLLDDSKFAHLCSLEFKSRECLNDFGNTADYCQTKEKAEKVYFDQEQLPNLVQQINQFGEINLGDKRSNEEENNGMNNG